MATSTILLTPDPDGAGYGVSVPALPGRFGAGATVEALGGA